MSETPRTDHCTGVTGFDREMCVVCVRAELDRKLVNLAIKLKVPTKAPQRLPLRISERTILHSPTLK